MRGWNQPEVDQRKAGNNLLIVDGMNLSFRFKHRGLTEFATDYLKTINSFAKSYSCKDIVCLTDFKGSKYRKELYPEYKGNRDYSNQTEQEKEQAEAFFEGYGRALELIDKSPVHLLKFPGIEADDVATYLVQALEEQYDNIWLISTDRDWDELLSPTVHRFSFANRKEWFVANFFEDHGCDDPEQYVMLKCLQGDLSDGIRGVEGIGVKRAYNIIRNYETMHDLIDDLPLSGNQKFIQNLNASEDLLLRNLELMDLRTFSGEIIASTDMAALQEIEDLINQLTDNSEFAEL